MKACVGAVVLLALLLAPQLRAQEHRRLALSGQVIDREAVPLADVRVDLRGTRNFAKTDRDGRFILDLGYDGSLKPDATTKAYAFIEFDKDGYLGQTLAIDDLQALDQPVTETLPPVLASEDRAEFTARVGMNHTLPPISPVPNSALIEPVRWTKYFAQLDTRKDDGLTEQVLFQAYVPKNTKKLRAIFLMTRHGIGSIDQPRLRAFADRNAVALVAVKGNPMQRGFYPVSLVDGYLARLGAMLSRPELSQLPLITFGHSNGTGFSGIFPSQRPDRVIAWISYHSGAAYHLQFPGVENVPGLVMHGLVDPFFNNGQEQTVLALRQERNAAIAMVIEPYVGHFPVDKDQNATWDFIVSFCEAALRVRLNDDGTLKPVMIEDGWLGANYGRTKGGQQDLVIASYWAFQEDRSRANWLPDERFASSWRLYEETDPRQK